MQYAEGLYKCPFENLEMLIWKSLTYQSTVFRLNMLRFKWATTRFHHHICSTTFKNQLLRIPPINMGIDRTLLTISIKRSNVNIASASVHINGIAHQALYRYITPHCFYHWISRNLPRTYKTTVSQAPDYSLRYDMRISYNLKACDEFTKSAVKKPPLVRILATPPRHHKASLIHQ